MNGDCKTISNAITGRIIPKITEFLGFSEVLCRFSFIEDAEYSPQEYLTMAKDAVSVGLKIDPKEFKRITNLSFIVEDDEWRPPAEPSSKEWSPEDKQALKEELE